MRSDNFEGLPRAPRVLTVLDTTNVLSEGFYMCNVFLPVAINESSVPVEGLKAFENGTFPAGFVSNTNTDAILHSCRIVRCSKQLNAQ